MKYKKFKPGDIVYDRYSRQIGQVILSLPKIATSHLLLKYCLTGQVAQTHKVWAECPTKAQIMAAKLLG